ncbi:MAG: hypothetical protein ACKVHE_28755 [Planctomycetales bacterium]
MAKTPSEERKPARQKIPSTKFPKAKRKIASGKFAKTQKAAKQSASADAPLERPTDEQSRQAALAILKDRAGALKAGRDATKQ